MVDGENNFSQNLFTSMLKMNFNHFAVRYFHPKSEVPHDCLSSIKDSFKTYLNNYLLVIRIHPSVVDLGKLPHCTFQVMAVVAGLRNISQDIQYLDNCNKASFFAYSQKLMCKLQIDMLKLKPMNKSEILNFKPF